jgi:uncharacterized protein (DUF58 family)
MAIAGAFAIAAADSGASRPVLTRRGYFAGGAAVVMIVFGHLLGIPELYAVAVLMLGVVAAALAYVRYFPWQVEALREVHPPQVFADGSSRVELAVRNVGTMRSPVLSARDPFDRGRRWARFHVAPLNPDEVVRAAYRLPTAERGIFPLGPLQITIADPFGMAQRVAEAAPAASLTVYPRVQQIRPLPEVRGADPTGATGRPSLTSSGEDFYGLRVYQTGDDLRRVHWASTARQDELMIRQDELPWQGRVTVLLDLRAEVHTAASVELALSAAVSVLHVSSKLKRQVRLVSSDGTDTGVGSGHAHISGMFEYLAAASAHATSSLTAALSRVARGSAGGGLVTITTDRASGDDLVAALRLRSWYGTTAVVLLEQSSWDAGNGRPPGPAPHDKRIIRVTAETPFPAAWNRAMNTAPSPAGARG